MLVFLHIVVKSQIYIRTCLPLRRNNSTGAMEPVPIIWDMNYIQLVRIYTMNETSDIDNEDRIGRHCHVFTLVLMCVLIHALRRHMKLYKICTGRDGGINNIESNRVEHCIISNRITSNRKRYHIKVMNSTREESYQVEFC